ncbi:hypothetical protein [Halomonas getboli]|uniref:hypothetical protein n=1 Tax=Halomonas getboli TaxID=2935862 RepID=UPI001FFF8F6A|nr:hypothetical protein [Halomonas getboli]MCK2183493.1 hypothetical protein [Halomonas getboli]
MTDIWIKLGLSLISLLVGVVLGHWLAIHRDTLRRFKDSAAPAKQQIINCLESERYWQALRGGVLDNVRHELNNRERRRLRQLESDYQRLCNEVAVYGPGGKWVPPAEEKNDEAISILEKIVGLISRPWWKIW